VGGNNCTKNDSRHSRGAGFLRGLRYKTPAEMGEGFVPMQERIPMKKMLLAALLSSFAVNGFAVNAVAQDATATCKAQAGDKQLAGAALRSFLTKCRKDAKATCDGKATEQKLAGAAKASFTRKCVTDAFGS
jgi:hypothetical protein